MKKTLYRIISFAFLMSIGVFLLNVKVYAASNIITISASGNTQGATVSGTTDDDVVAVLIEILDESNGIITLETHAVTNGNYNATLSCALTEGKTYTAYVVNYNGAGTPQRTSFTVPVSVTGVSLNKTAETITTAGGTLQLTATVSPANASNQNVTWSTSDASVATVDATGKVTAQGNGTAIITVTTEDGGKTAAATITVAINSSTEDGSEDTSDDSSDDQSTDANTSAKEETVSVPIEYIVVKGDTLSKIARLNHLTLSQILAMNPQIKNPNLIRIGQKIIVGHTSKVVTSQTTTTKSDAAIYIVKKGDSLYKIARRHNMTYTRLIALNPDVVGRKYIYPGQKIRVK